LAFKGFGKRIRNTKLQAEKKDSKKNTKTMREKYITHQGGLVCGLGTERRGQEKDPIDWSLRACFRRKREEARGGHSCAGLNITLTTGQGEIH